ncbi:bifunctional 2-polyprenyl-6-hydroxyphenol methylase/3-demethylubiquinol 3-O-methyltransferase UbiG [Sphingomonas sp.]|uniref:class I SAM-dependent methyltransferase n=1 Tax=Sphingomonas sp. TaxID=28214 RepID=UPI000DB2D917|nr:class I SAM-dependent methyltransferase [Sphingomonas sp.]PZU09055.1 MAG: SAM-dependent methyltransferase [Sphingomonas sp.]
MAAIHEASGEPTLAAPVSQACTAAQFAEPEYARWADAIREPVRTHRKQWEFIYILRVLESRGLLRPGVRALGFGVGFDPLTAVLAAHGLEVTATDLAPDAAAAGAWIETSQHAPDLAALNGRGICDPHVFAANVRHEHADMRAIPKHFRDYDVVFSSCAFEHLGTLKAGADFVIAALDALKPGGLAVHTTEHNLNDTWRTRRRGATVLYRRRDLQRIFARAEECGFGTTVNWSRGEGEVDRHIDLPPYNDDPHVKLLFRGYEMTSFGLVLEG